MYLFVVTATVWQDEREGALPEQTEERHRNISEDSQFLCWDMRDPNSTA
jgi:hypothetical protein